MEFKEVKLGEISNINMGQSPRSEFYSEFEGTPFLQGNRTFQHIYPLIDTYTNKITKLANKNDILFSVRAPVGDMNIAPVDLCIGRGLCAINSTNSNQEFLFYLLKSKLNELESHSTGTIFSSVNKKTLENFIVKVPSDSHQKNIGRLLSNLDKKIEINQNIIANLEELSQTLFKRWFVDFEFPDENGNSYKSSGGEMVESELGEIPKFWKISKLEEIIDYSNKSIDVEKSLDKLDYIGLEHIPKNNKISINNWENSSKIKGKKTLVSKGDILFGKLRPYFQKIGISPINGVVSTDILVIRPKKEEFYYFLLVYISQNKFIQYTTNTATGTRMPRTGTKQINTYKLILPPVSTLELFNTTLKNITINILQKNQEIRTLEILRDTLLPKLMSGELEIPDDIEVNEDELSI